MRRETPAPPRPTLGELTSRLAAAERALADRAAELRALGGRELMFRSIVENLDRVFWILTPDLKRVIYMSPAFEAIWGVELKVLDKDPEAWMAPIPPEDRARLKSAIALRLHDLPVEPGLQVFRITRPDGSQRWIRGRGMLVPAPDGGEWYIGVAEDITELKRASDVEGERAALLRLMTQQLPAVIWTTDPDLVFTSSAGRGLGELHREPNEVVGMRLQDYFGTEDLTFTPLAAHRRALAGEALTYGFEWASRVFESHVEPLRDATGRTIGVLGLALDITERKRAEAAARAAHEDLRRAHEDLHRAHAELRRAHDELEARVQQRTAALNFANEKLRCEVEERLRAEESLRRSAEVYRLLAEHATDVISRFTPEGVYIYVSPACRSVFGYAPEELLGRNAYDFIHPDDWEATQQSHQQVLAGSEVVALSFRFRRKDGRYCWIEVTSKRIENPDTGAVEEIIAVTRDISERKEAEERLARLQEELAHVARVSTIGEMASGLAHELNQPLTAVSNYLDAGRRLLESGGQIAPEVHAALAEAASEAQRAGKIIRSMRALSRRGNAEQTTAGVNALVRDVLELAAADIRGREVKLELRLAPDLRPVYVDRVQVQQVILNLIRNALEAMQDGACRERRLTICTDDSGREIEIAVSDTGPGLTDDVKAQMFNAFFTTKKDGGTGLGLPISRSIVEAHGGRLWAESELGVGTTMHFTLPAARTIPPSEEGP